MATAVKRKLSESADGRAILLNTIATPGNLLHTAVVGVLPGTFDEVWLWAFNSGPYDLVLTIEFGGIVAPDYNIVVTVPFKAGLVPVVPGFILQNGVLVRAFAATANIITITGFVNAITD